MSGFRSFGASFLVAAAVAAVAFGAKGGTELGRTTTVEVLLILAGGAAVVVAILFGRRGPLYGGAALAAFAALTAYTALSVTWSIVPDLSFQDAGRMLAYLAVFGAAVGAARLAPRGSTELATGLLLGCVLICGYALLSRVFPGSLADDELYARIGQPFGYWNAVGATAAFALPLGLWLGSRRTAPVTLRVAVYPAMGVLLLALALTQSRGAIAAAAVGAVLWFAIVPLRLRSLPVALAPAAIAGGVAAWALSQDAFTEDFQPVSVREAAAGDFALLVLAMLALLLVAGLAVNLGVRRGLPPVRLRRRVGVAALAAACAVPLVLFTGVAFSDRGLGGTISDQVDKLTDDSAATPTGAQRLTSASSSRAGYWREAGKVFDDKPATGTGANTFGIARLRYRKNELVSRHAHGFVPQTLADLGWVGLLIALALLAAWLAAGLRTTGLVPRMPWRKEPPPRRDWTPERVALVALGLAAVVFGVQSLVDWTWFTPAPSVAALLAGGFVVGRGRLTAPPDASPSGSPVTRRALAALVAFAALLCAWTAYQPERSDRVSDRALDLLAGGDAAGAAAEAERAAEIDPLSSKPYLVKASALAAGGRDTAALRTLERTVLRYPSEPTTWTRLASFQLTRFDRPALAIRTIGGALYLDPKSKTARRVFLQARARLRQQEIARAQRRRR